MIGLTCIINDIFVSRDNYNERILVLIFCLAPYIPPIDPANAGDTQNFDETFLDMQPILDDPYENEGTDGESQGQSTDTDKTDGDDSSTNTPSQSRSSSVPPKVITEDDSVDVFDGYSFKGRHSVLIDSDEEFEGDESSDEETDEDEFVGDGIAPALGPADVDQEEEEPVTPEARPFALPVEESVETPIEIDTPIEATPASVVPRVSKEQPRSSKEQARLSRDVHEIAPSAPVKEAELEKAPVTKPAPPKPAKAGKGRREKSGVQALDKHLEGDDAGADREEEDDDWDFIEADGGEDRNGKQATSLFARGVVDKYKLAVFRKASTPSQLPPRSASGISTATGDSDMPGTPSPSQRRGRNSGPLFRKSPRAFGKTSSKSTPPSSFSSKSALQASQSSATNGTTTPTTLAESPSLRSRESRSGMSSSSETGETSPSDGVSTVAPQQPSRATSPDMKTKSGQKLKKYKEKMLGSIFSGASSPRPPHQQP